MVVERMDGRMDVPCRVAVRSASTTCSTVKCTADIAVTYCARGRRFDPLCKACSPPRKTPTNLAWQLYCLPHRVGRAPCLTRRVSGDDVRAAAYGADGHVRRLRRHVRTVPACSSTSLPEPVISRGETRTRTARVGRLQILSCHGNAYPSNVSYVYVRVCLPPSASDLVLRSTLKKIAIQVNVLRDQTC